MQVENLTLGIPEKAVQMLQDGTAYRDGGIVREVATGRIVAFLQDTDGQARALAETNVVPLAVFGVSIAAVNRRLQRIEAELRALKSLVADVAAAVNLANVKLDGELIGRLLGALQACHLDIEAGLLNRLGEYRPVFLEAYYQFRYVVEGVIVDPDLLRRYEPVASCYAQAMFLSGIAARDVSYRMGDDAGALHLTGELARHSTLLAENLRNRITAPSALFWRGDGHVEFCLDMRESAARLRSHEESLRLLPKGEVGRLVAEQLLE